MAMRNPDIKQYVNLYNILTQKGQRTFVMYLMMTQPWEPTASSNGPRKHSGRSRSRSTPGPAPTRTPTSCTGSRTELFPERRPAEKLLFTPRAP